MSIKYSPEGKWAIKRQLYSDLHLERSTFSSALMVTIQCITSLPKILHTVAVNADPNSCLPKLKPCSMKTIQSLRAGDNGTAGMYQV